MPAPSRHLVQHPKGLRAAPKDLKQRSASCPVELDHVCRPRKQASWVAQVCREAVSAARQDAELRCNSGIKTRQQEVSRRAGNASFSLPKRASSAGASVQRRHQPGLPESPFIGRRNDISRKSKGNIRTRCAKAKEAMIACKQGQKEHHSQLLQTMQRARLRSTAPAASQTLVHSHLKTSDPDLENDAVEQGGGSSTRQVLAGSADLKDVLEQNLVKDAVGKQEGSVVVTKQRPASAPLLQMGFRRPKPFSQENPVAAMMRKGEIRLQTVPDNAAHLYNCSEYRRAFPPAKEDPLPDVKVRPLTHAPTAPV